MRIVHICLASVFTPGMRYQENLLSEQNAADGHDVTVIASCHRYYGNEIVRVAPEDVVLSSGVRLIRVSLTCVLSSTLSDRIRRSPLVRTLLSEIAPDVVLHHGAGGWSLTYLRSFKKQYPDSRVYIDSHADAHNSARNWFSRVVQYKLFNRILLRVVAPSVDRIFYVSYEARDFLTSLLGVEGGNLEFFPLGGYPVSKGERAKVRERVRGAYGLSESTLVFLHSGKFSTEKRTIELLEAFRQVKGDAVLLLAGGASAEYSAEIEAQTKRDQRIRTLGWLPGDALSELMCAADVYVQPGSQSASLQAAICSGLPVIVYPFSSHAAYVRDNGFFAATTTELIRAMNAFQHDRGLVDRGSAASTKLAMELLDYRRLAARLYV